MQKSIHLFPIAIQLFQKKLHLLSHLRCNYIFFIKIMGNERIFQQKAQYKIL